MGSLHARGRGGGIIFVVVAAAAMSIQEPEHESVGFNRGPPPVYSGTEPLKVVYEEESSEMNEKSPLLSNSTTSLSNKDVKESMDGNGNKDVNASEKKKSRRKWLSIYIMYFTMFTVSVSFSIVISSIWAYLLEVDYTNATTNFLGWVVASFSIGQLVASPLFGLWADKRPTWQPLLAALLLSIIFNLLYAYCGAFGSGIAGYVMIVSRVIVGVGSGIGSVARSYVAEATTTEERTGAMAFIGAVQALGFIIGPVLGLAFVPLGSEGLSISAIRFKLNMFTGPGFLSALVALLNLILILILFRESKLVDRNAKKGPEEEETKKKVEVYQNVQIQEGSVLHPLPMKRVYFDWLGAVACIFIFFIILSVFSVFETLLSPLTMDEFGWTKKQAILYNNAFFAGLSVLTILTVIGVKYASKRVDERVILMVGLIVLDFAFFVLIPMGNEPPKVLSMSSLTLSDHPNASVLPIVPLTTTNETLEEVGCRDPPQEWCSHVPRIYFPQLIVALILVTFGYAASSIPVFSIFSKLLGPFPQGIMMGVLTSSGSSARALGPLALSYLYQHYGPSVTFCVIVGILSFTVLFLLVLSCRMIPYERYASKKKLYVNLP